MDEKLFRKVIAMLLVFLVTTQSVFTVSANAATVSSDSTVYDADVIKDSSYTGETIYPLTMIDDFNGTDDWTTGVNVKSSSNVSTILNNPGTPYEGSGCLDVVPEQVKCYEWRSIDRDFSSQPLDLSDANFLAVAANIWGWKSNDFYLRVNLYSGSDKFTATCPINANQWNKIYYDIRECDFKDSITKIEFSYMKNFNLSGVNPGDPGYDYWDGHLQLDELCATSAADFDFQIPDCTEGFTASEDGSTVAQKSDPLDTLVFTAGTADSYLQSPDVNVDAAKYNIIKLSGTDSTASASKIKMQWITSDDTDWSDSKSVTADLDSDFSEGLEFKPGLSPDWSGTIKQVRFELVNGAANDMINIDKMEFSYEETDAYSYAGSLISCEVDGNKTDVILKGSIESAGSAEPQSVSVYQLPLYADEKSEDYSSLTALGTVTTGFDSFQFSIPIAELTDISDKFVAVLTKKDGSTQLVDCPHYVTNPGVLSENTQEYPQAKSIKGLQVQLTSDAENLGVQHAAINISYNSMLTLSDHGASSTIPYTYEGNTYYFIKSTIDSIDNQVKSLTNNNILVNAILIMYATGLDDPDSPNKYMIHPNAFDGGTVYAVNLTDETGVRYYKAITSFLAQRYSEEDKQYGRIEGYIVGNEVGQNSTWNDAGPMLVGQYVKEYERQLRLTNAIVKQAWCNSRVYLSIDHFWNMGNPTTSTSLYDNKTIVDLLNEDCISGGNFDWNVAFHPYPQDLFNPRTWNDKDATDSFDTYCITFKNLQVLTKYLQQPDYQYGGKQRHVILSEQGFTSSDNSVEAQKLQAAAYAYAYYKSASLPGIDAFILHRHVDHNLEGGLKLGLWTCLNGYTCEAGTQKTIYDVFKNIDTVNSLNTTNFALTVIGDDLGKTVTNWSEVIPEFDSSKITEELKRPVQQYTSCGITSNQTGTTVLENFENGATGWYATDNTESVSTISDSETASKVLTAPIGGGWIKDYKGVTYMPSNAADFSSTPIITVDIKAKGIGAGKKAEYMIKAYSGDNVMQGSFVGDAEKWNTASIDLTGWSGLSSVDRIKVWARPVEDISWGSGDVSVDNLKASASADIRNLSVTLDPSKVKKVGDVVNVTITNNGNKAVSGTAAISGTNGLTMDISSYAVSSLGVGKSITIPVTIQEMNIPQSQVGGISIAFEGQTFTYNITDIQYQDYVMDGSDMVFGDFENESTDGWVAGANTSSICSVTSDSINHAPSSANHGSYMLQATKDGSKSAVKESTITKTFSQPLDLSQISNIKFDFYGWAGTSSSYTARFKLTASDGTSKSYDTTYNGNTWQTISEDISDFSGRKSVASISVSYFGNDLNNYSGGWSGEFFVDNVRATPASHATALTADKSSETIALNGDSMQIVLRKAISDGSTQLASSAASGTVYNGYNSNIISVSMDGFVTPKAVGTTTVTATNSGLTSKVTVTVSNSLPMVLYGFENGSQGWVKEDDNVASVAAEVSLGGAVPQTGYPKALNGGSMLHVTMAAVDPSVRKMAFVSTNLDLTHATKLAYSIYSWGGVPAMDGTSIQYNTVLRLTGDDGTVFEKVNSISSDSWNNIEVDLTGCKIKKLVKAEIGEYVDNSAILAWGGNFFIDNVTMSSSGNSQNNHSKSTKEDKVIQPAEPKAAAPVSDTNGNLSVKSGASYVFKITGAASFYFGTPGVFRMELVKKSNGNSYYRIIAIGQPGQETGFYMVAPGQAPQKVCVATVGVSQNVAAMKSDTNGNLAVRPGTSYIFKITGAASFYFGTSGVFQTELVGKSGNDSYYKITAIGKSGQTVGFYMAAPGQAPRKVCVAAVANTAVTMR